MKNLAIVLVLCFLTAIGVFIAMGGLKSQIETAKNTGSDSKPLTTEREFREKLAEIKMNRYKLEKAIEKLERRKADNVQYLKEKGIRKVADAQGDPNAEMALRNLKGWTESIEELKGQLTKYDSAIARIQGMLKELERQFINDSASLTEEQEVELRSIVLDLDDRLGMNENDVLADAELDALLDAELQDSGNDSKKEPENE